jgi:hypothetical protein
MQGFVAVRRGRPAPGGRGGCRQKKRGLLETALEDSTIGGEWRNAPAVPKEEYGEAADSYDRRILQRTTQLLPAMQHRPIASVANLANVSNY